MRVFGIDAGIASVGWAVLDISDDGGKIVACGTRMFDTPETAKDRKPKKQHSTREARFAPGHTSPPPTHERGTPAPVRKWIARFRPPRPWPLVSTREASAPRPSIARSRQRS